MEKTIAAISTAMSASGIGIVRISGDEAMDVISRIYRSKNGKKNIREVQSHTIHYGFIYDGEDVVDEVLVMIMRGPHTYTGEDTVEIDCHEEGSGNRAQKRSRDRRTRRIYKESFLKRKAGSVAGGGCHGCHSGQKLHGTQELRRTAQRLRTACRKRDPEQTALPDRIYRICPG